MNGPTGNGEKRDGDNETTLGVATFNRPEFARRNAGEMPKVSSVNEGNETGATDLACDADVRAEAPGTPPGPTAPRPDDTGTMDMHRSVI